MVTSSPPWRPTAATLVDEVEPIHWESAAEFSLGSRGSGLIANSEVPFVRMDVDDSPSQSLIGALEQDLMSSQEEEVGSHHSAEEEGDPVVHGPRASRRLVLVGGCQDSPVANR